MLHDCQLMKIEEKDHPHQTLPPKEEKNETKKQRMMKQLEKYYVPNIFNAVQHFKFNASSQEFTGERDTLPSVRIARRYNENEQLKDIKHDIDLYIAYIKHEIYQFISKQEKISVENNEGTILIDFSSYKMGKTTLNKIIEILRHQIFTHFYGEYEIDVTFDYGDKNPKKFGISRTHTIMNYNPSVNSKDISIYNRLMSCHVKNILLTPKGIK